MIYTSYEMMRDCREDKPEGWSYFIPHYIPVIRAIVDHYFPERRGDAALVERLIAAFKSRESELFHSMDPCAERYFAAALRQQVLEMVESDRVPRIALDLVALAAALEPLTLTEREVAWFETMRYGKDDTGRLLRMNADTVEKIRGRASEMIRAGVDAWQRNLLEENGRALGVAAASGATEDCVTAKALFDVIDGRATWNARQEMERHALTCWHCIDHFCRLWEANDIMRTVKPLSAAEAEPLQRALGVLPAKPSGWRKFLARY